MKIIERIRVVTPIAKVASAFQTLLAEHGYACRAEATGNGLRLVIGDGQLAIELVGKSESRRPAADRQPTSQQPFRVLGDLGRRNGDRRGAQV